MSSREWVDRQIHVDGLRFRYLEAGPSDAETVVLLHSGEYGASAEFSWEYNIPTLAREYHVLAPDMIGFGLSSKLFDFEDPLGFRLRTVQMFCDALNVDGAHFLGNSFGGTLACYAATLDECPWPMRSLLCASAGGRPAENDSRRFIQDYDGSAERMDAIQLLTFTRRWYDDEYIERRVAMSRVTGGWECASAARLKAPFREPNSEFAPFRDLPYERIAVPTLVFAGGADQFREPGYALELGERIPDVEVVVMPEAGHMAHIEFADEFNQTALSFLRSHPFSPAR